MRTMWGAGFGTQAVGHFLTWADVPLDMTTINWMVSKHRAVRLGRPL